MSNVEKKAVYAVALEERDKDAMRLWKRLEGDTKFENKKALRRYSACLRLCAWLQKKIKE